MPEANQARQMPGGRIEPAKVKETVQNALVKRYGPGEWISGFFDMSIYLNHSLIEQKNLNRADVQREAARAVEAIPHIFPRLHHGMR